MPAPPSLSFPKSERAFLFTLSGVQFTHILDFMIMMPLGPQLIRILDISTNQFALLLSSYTFAAALSGFLAATFIDRFDRRNVMLALYVLFILATLMCGLAPGYLALLIARAMAGAFGGMLGAMVHTMVADAIPFERRGQAMGTVMAAFSLSTVAGVPLGLLLSNQLPALGWRAPFFFIIFLAGIVLWMGLQSLPSMTAHMTRSRSGNAFQQIYQVAKEPNHRIAFAYISLQMLAGFSVIPYLALYMTANIGLPESFLTVIYLCGGTATFFSARLIGRMADKHGKATVFTWVALASFIPVLVATHLVPVPWWVALINSTVFFVLVSGRMIPGMAMVSAAASQPVRGTFMSLISSVQMLSSGFASLVAGLIITRAPSGQLEHYNIVGYLAVTSGLAAIWMIQRLKVAADSLPSAPVRISG